MSYFCLFLQACDACNKHKRYDTLFTLVKSAYCTYMFFKDKARNDVSTIYKLFWYGWWLNFVLYVLYMCYVYIFVDIFYYSANVVSVCCEGKASTSREHVMMLIYVVGDRV